MTEDHLIICLRKTLSAAVRQLVAVRTVTQLVPGSIPGELKNNKPCKYHIDYQCSGKCSKLILHIIKN